MKGIDQAKELTASTGPRGNEISLPVQLNGVLPEERLTPKLAARAARVAFGHRDGVTVWDNEHGYGYRLYKESARKLYPEQ
jgi:hypothetical protein